MGYTVTTGWARPIAGAAKEGDIEITEIQLAATGGAPRPEPGLDLVPATEVAAERSRIRRELLAGYEYIRRAMGPRDNQWTNGVFDALKAAEATLDRICPEEG